MLDFGKKPNHRPSPILLHFKASGLVFNLIFCLNRRLFKGCEDEDAI
jgi:hypothetical protein